MNTGKQWCDAAAYLRLEEKSGDPACADVCFPSLECRYETTSSDDSSSDESSSSGSEEEEEEEEKEKVSGGEESFGNMEGNINEVLVEVERREEDGRSEKPEVRERWVEGWWSQRMSLF